PSKRANDEPKFLQERIDWTADAPTCDRRFWPTTHRTLHARAAPSRGVFPCKETLLYPVIGSFASDDHVVNVALAQARGRNLPEFAVVLHLLQAGHAAITHAAAQAAHELIDQSGERAFVRYLPFDSFGHRFSALGTFLAVAIRGAGLHRRERAHAAIGFEG